MHRHHHLVLTGQCKTLGVRPEIIRLDEQVQKKGAEDGGRGITVGRSRQKCNLILGSTRGPLMISRIHATLEPILKEGDKKVRWKLIDHSSRNGTFVNNMKVSEVILEHGDSITFGGGGLLPYGSMKHQIDSEFTYTYLEGNEPVTRNAQYPDSRSPDQKEWRRLSGRLERKTSSFDVEAQGVSSNSRKRIILLTGRVPNSKKRLRMKSPTRGTTTTTTTSEIGGQSVPSPPSSNKDVEKKSVVLTQKRQCRCEAKDDAKITKDDEDDEHRKKQRRGQEQLRKEFMCPVCLDYFVATQTLACGHSFCSSCIGTCLESKRQCPVCRSKRPVRSCALDGAIRALLEQEKSSSDIAMRYQKRQKQWKSEQRKERRTATKLRTVIRKAKDEGKHFLSIHKRWNQEERDLFRRGVVMYRGPARIEYCKTIDLTADFIDSKMFRDLVGVAINLGIISEDGSDAENASSITSLSSLRARLHMFILYG